MAVHIVVKGQGALPGQVPEKVGESSSSKYTLKSAWFTLKPKLPVQSSIFDLIQLDYLILSQIVSVFGSMYDIIRFKDTHSTHA